MKTPLPLLLVAFFTLFSGSAMAQCPTGDVTFNSQQAVNDFGQDYPSCTTIYGNLTISGSDISDLTPLENITQIDGILEITSNGALTSLNGLNNIQFIDRGLYINNNNLLTSLQGLEGLTQMLGSVDISFNNSLTTLNGINNLQSIDGGLYISENGQLTSLQALENLTQVQRSVYIILNYSLTSLNGLHNLQSIGSHLNILSCYQLNSLQALENLTQVSDNVSIVNIDLLTSLNGLNNLQSIGGRLRIEDNSQLASLQALENLTQISGNLEIKNNDALISLDGLQNIPEGSISNLIIQDNDTLSFCAIENLCTYITNGGTATIQSNASGCASVPEVQNDCNRAIQTGPGPGTGFITTWQTNIPGTSENTEITIPTEEGGYDYNIYWVEVGNSSNSGSTTGITGEHTITFPSAGTYQVEITGDFPRIYFNNDGDKDKILNIKQWGDITWSSMNNAFAGCINLQGYATDAPDLSNVTDLSFMFDLASAFNQDLNNWDVSNITNMTYLFNYATSFNGDISNWDVQNVERFQAIFRHAHSFNQDISGWNVMSGWDFQDALAYAEEFDQNLGNWNFQNGTSFISMLDGSGLSTANYDATLIGWAAKENVPTGITLGADGLTYCNALVERQSLIDDHGWTVTGDAVESGDCGMVINLRMENEDIIRIRTYSSNSIQQLKYQIQDQTNILYDRQTLSKGETELMLGLTLGDYNIQHGDTLDLIINHFPTLANPIPDQFGSASIPFSFQFAANTFDDIEEDILIYTSQLSGGGEWPAWLSFEPSTRTFSGTPGASDIGSIIIVVIADDGITDVYGYEDAAKDTFMLTIADRLDVTISTATSSPTNQPFTVEVTFSESVTGFTMGDINVTNATLSDFQTNDNIVFHVLASPTTDGTVTVQVPANVATNIHNSPNTASNELNILYDITPPQVVTQDITVELNASGYANVQASDIDNGSSDANGIASRHINQTQFNCSHLGDNSVTLTVTDESGNSANDDATVRVVDSMVPIPVNQTLPDITAQCEVTTEDVTPPIATDNCSDGTITATTDFVFPATENGTITWTFEDAAGNTATQTQNIVIQDTEAPEPDNETLGDIAAQCVVTAEDVSAPTATDNCTDGTITATTDFVFPTLESGTITWTFEDDAGNKAMQTQSIVIQDTEAPAPVMQTLPDIVAQCEVTAEDVTPPISTDNCTDGTITATTEFVFPASESGTITWTFEDEAGNKVTQTQDIFIQDTEAPAPAYQNLPDITAQCEVTAEDMTPPTATDNCGGTITATPNATFPITTQGTTTITWTYEDAAGNMATQTQDIIILDNVAPIPDSQPLNDITGQCEVTAADVTPPTATDYCSGSITATTNATFPITTQGTTTITWTFEDDAGNKTTQTQSIVIQDTEAPAPTYQNLPDITAQCEVTAEDVTPPTATDNCSGSITATTDFIFPTSENGTITWTYEDEAGNTFTQTQNVVIQNNTAPVPDSESLADFTAQCEVTATDVTPPTATDYCSGSITATTNATFPITTHGTTTITWTYEDAEGNTSTQTQKIVIQDNVAPVPVNQSLANITAQCEVTAADVSPPTAIDNCGGSITATTDFIFPASENGTITWTYEDEAGNTSTQTQKIVIQVTSVPEMECPTILMEGWNPLIPYDYPEASDVCGPVPVVQTDATGLTFGSQFPLGFKILTFQATNSAGSSTCQVLEVILPNLLFLQNSDIQEGDTLQVPASIPPHVSKSNLEIDSVNLIPGAITNTSSPVVTETIEPDPEKSIISGDIKVYPNPTTGRFQVALPFSDKVDYSVYNQLGQLVKKGQAENGSEIDLTNSPNGMYFIRIIKDQSQVIIKRILLMAD